MITPERVRRTAAQKIAETAKQIRKPKDGAAGPELALSTLGTMLSDPKAKGWLEQAEEDGNLDPFLRVLLVWIASMRGDDSPMLVIIEVPRNRDLPAGTILHRVAEAKQLAEAPPPDLVPGDDDEIEVELPALQTGDEMGDPEGGVTQRTGADQDSGDDAGEDPPVELTHDLGLYPGGTSA